MLFFESLYRYTFEVAKAYIQNPKHWPLVEKKLRWVFGQKPRREEGGANGQKGGQGVAGMSVGVEEEAGGGISGVRGESPRAARGQLFTSRTRKEQELTMSRLHVHPAAQRHDAERGELGRRAHAPLPHLPPSPRSL